MATTQKAQKAAATHPASDMVAAERDQLWYKDAVIYQCHIKSFFDSNADGYGDIPGLLEKLDYIQELGISVIWLLPFYSSPLRDDGYDIADYYTVNPIYGTIDDFKTLVNETHRRGLRIITELVVNHTSDQHHWFQAARMAPPGSPKREFYVWSDTDKKYQDAGIIFLDYEASNWTWDPVANAYYWHRFFHHQPDLNFDNPEVFEAVVDAMKFWFDMGVDGLRLDAIPYLIEREGTNCENLPETHEVLKRLRKVVDENYDGRVFLAEANQCPQDLREYFGNGDECHMAFNFPIMPRMYLALHQEDKRPVEEILGQTPEIPEPCQWALFLRNHDELTLEMVTDRERDYMWKNYARDPRARINLGIRRRLAPLMEYSRPRIQLMNALLFALPGTPVVYYGDEIGMGDNLSLPDRYGVRTPMQWTADKNGGFSRAESEKLYLPPIMDTVSGFHCVNVEAQQKDPSSLLHWMRNIIELRRRHKVFGRGIMQIVENSNCKVFSFIRKYEDEAILVVANLSRHAQSAELDLQGCGGVVPVEMFGLAKFHAVGECPYVVTLGPYEFFYLQLAGHEGELEGGQSEELVARPAVPSASPRQARVQLKDAIPADALADDTAAKALEEEILPSYIQRQRWYGGKSQAIKTVKIRDICRLPDGPALSAVVFVDVTTLDGMSELYSLFLAQAEGDLKQRLKKQQPDSIVCELVSTKAGGVAVIYDALENEDFCRALLRLVSKGQSVTAKAGKLSVVAVSKIQKELAALASGTIKRVRSEQSNSSVIFDDQFILKIYRRLQIGANPDYEIGSYLTDVAGFKNTPAVAGAIEYTLGKAGHHLALLQKMVQHQGDGWTYAVDELRRYYERAATHMHLLQDIDPGKDSLYTLAGQRIPTKVYELFGLFLIEAATLGQRTGEMHVALSANLSDDAFKPEAFAKEELQGLVGKMKERVIDVTSRLRSVSGLPDEMSAHVDELIGARSKVEAKLDALVSLAPQLLKMRVHGDYHLGQVLHVGGDFVIFDFEGEPLRPLVERRAKNSALKDVAGMVRSFSYAAYAALFLFMHQRSDDVKRYLPWTRAARIWLSTAFLNGYLTAVKGQEFVPETKDVFVRGLEPYILEKAFYEIDYEMNNRPDWLRIPLTGVFETLRNHDATTGGARK
jgi:maltose alpha-D-glucosyltransferase/alpha-amylase